MVAHPEDDPEAEVCGGLRRGSPVAAGRTTGPGGVAPEPAPEHTPVAPESAPADRPRTQENSRRHRNPCTTPTHFGACRAAPRRSAPSRRPDAWPGRSSCRISRDRRVVLPLPIGAPHDERAGFFRSQSPPPARITRPGACTAPTASHNRRAFVATREIPPHSAAPIDRGRPCSPRPGVGTRLAPRSAASRGTGTPPRSRSIERCYRSPPRRSVGRL
jgi:hypothetical protein